MGGLIYPTDQPGKPQMHDRNQPIQRTSNLAQALTCTIFVDRSIAALKTPRHSKNRANEPNSARMAAYLANEASGIPRKRSQLCQVDSSWLGARRNECDKRSHRILYTKSRPLDSPSKLRERSHSSVRTFRRPGSSFSHGKTARTKPTGTHMDAAVLGICVEWNRGGDLVVKESESSIPCSQSPKEASECGWVDAATGSRWTGKGRGSARFACRRGLESGLFLPVATVRGVHYPPRRNSGTCPRITWGRWHR